jgi:hypothetical protein
VSFLVHESNCSVFSTFISVLFPYQFLNLQYPRCYFSAGNGSGLEAARSKICQLNLSNSKNVIIITGQLFWVTVIKWLVHVTLLISARHKVYFPIMFIYCWLTSCTIYQSCVQNYIYKRMRNTRKISGPTQNTNWNFWIIYNKEVNSGLIRICYTSITMWHTIHLISFTDSYQQADAHTLHEK